MLLRLALNVGLGGDPREIIFGTMALPSFHAMGVYSQLFYPLFTGRPSAIFTPQYPHLPAVSSPGAALTAMKQTKTNVVFVVPTFFEVTTPHPFAYTHGLYNTIFRSGRKTPTPLQFFRSSILQYSQEGR